ncbi:MAG TPA: DnaJ domain-containing protein [Acidimicrobiales bacterium]
MPITVRGGERVTSRMVTRDPYTILGISPDATLVEARAAYRRLAELFHPDHLQGLRREVQDEGAARLREATDAMRAIRARLGRPLVAPGHHRGEETNTAEADDRPGPTRPASHPASPVPRNATDHDDGGWRPSDSATATRARLYDVDLRGVDGPPFHVRWTGRHAAATLTALRHGHRVEGSIRQVEWGCYEVVLDGAATRRLICSVLPDVDWHGDLAEVLQLEADLDAEPLPVPRNAVPGSSIELGALLTLLDDGRWYSVLADVY